MGWGIGTSSVVVGKHHFPRPPRVPLPARLPRLLPELLLLVAVNAVYKYGRKVANGHTDEAYRHADSVWSFERGVHLPSEASVQRLMLHSETVIHAANYLYATVHFPAMVIFLGWMFAKKRAHYLWIRRAIVIQTMLALIGHLFFPLAPPRLLKSDGMVDTAAAYGPAVYGKPDGDSLANQFAAMPSLHVGWALAIAVGLIAAYRSRWRWLWLLHPLVTMLVVVGTANHYWLDCIVGCALLGVGLAVIPGPVTDPPELPADRRHWAWPLKRRPVQD
ncbi:PAP2 superfamily protein [Actinacidiphila paucisporea]|uniref:PAP2 superfamily protein n=2 Tax=Actinacidiphila paucisporea TaxID=310782 RepID=A0A1M6UDF4_9ACTN|nr:PAP2 superfamily protein [Actinacidiphila paucisporea]